jgi:hypothetical protein
MKALLAAALLLLIAPAAAQSQQRSGSAPYDMWCRDQGISRGSIMVCWAYTFEQCMASRTSHTESCYLNPKYDPRFSEWRKRNPNR